MARIKSVSLYADNDISLSNPIYAFNQDDYTSQELVKNVLLKERELEETARLAALEKVDFVDDKYILLLYASLINNGMSEIEKQIKLEAKNKYGNSPIDQKKYIDDQKNKIEMELKNFATKQLLWLPGTIELNQYDIDKEDFQIKHMSLSGPIDVSNNKNINYTPNNFRPPKTYVNKDKLPKAIKVTIDRAELIAKQFKSNEATNVFKARFSMVPDTSIKDRLGFKIVGIEMLSGKDADPQLLDEQNVLWKFTYDEEKVKAEENRTREIEEKAKAAEAARQEQIAAKEAERKQQVSKLMQQCKYDPPPATDALLAACRDACEKLRPIADNDELNICNANILSIKNAIQLSKLR